ncbi:Adaptor protein complex AP-3 delta subunit [Clavulina sp. PMI_390]|nr:Adaptor protein complex AP-3 delta subunit [Clavulina sp. PMI_390]
MFERTLADLIRGLRASSKQDEAVFIARAVDEIRKEVKTKDMELKAAAVLKLTYLDMMGYDMSWASFNVVEVMSAARIHLKAVGYLAAVQSFKEDTDVLMLTTNTLKKDLGSPNPADIATALDGLSHIVTPDIGRDLSLDLIAMLNHSRPRIRKRAVLVMFKVFEKYPDAIARSMPRLREKLEDQDPGVVSATVNILCELARRNPADYLPLAPQLFDLLTKSSNNWMLIKLIKLLGALTPHEPRLVKKLLKPINELISTTPAVSLLYECVRTCIIGGMLDGNTTASNALAKTCVNKLSAFLSDADQNLKYIALLAMVKIVPTHPHLVAMHQNEILSSLEDHDLSIRMRALDLVSSMVILLHHLLVTVSNVKSIVQRLLSHLVPPEETSASTTSPAAPSAAEALVAATAASTTTAPTVANPNSDPSYRRTLAERIVDICSRLANEAYPAQARSQYEYSYDDDGDSGAFDFAWYISVLVDLTYVAPASVDTGIGHLIRDQLLEVAMHVTDGTVRRRTVELMAKLVGDDGMLDGITQESERSTLTFDTGSNGEEEVLWAAAWICGEFCSDLQNPPGLLPTFLHSPNVHRLSERTQSAYLQASLKIFGHWAASLSPEWDNSDDLATKKFTKVMSQTKEDVEKFASSEYIEVQERAANMLQLFAFIKADFGSHQAKQQAKAEANTTDDTSPDQFSTEPEYPKSLFLIQPLHARALRPLPIAGPSTSRHVSFRVTLPEGLDLDSWIVPPPKSSVVFEAQGDEDHVPGVPSGKKKKSKDKGDGKVKTTKSKKGKQKEDGGSRGNGESLDTPEEQAARVKRKAELAEERRNDPFYLSDKPRRPATRPPDEEEVDSIPVVKLDLGSLLSPGTYLVAADQHSLHLSRTFLSSSISNCTILPADANPPPKGSFTSVRSSPSTPIAASTPHDSSASPASTPSGSLLSSSFLNSSSAQAVLATARKASGLGLSASFSAAALGGGEESGVIPENERPVGVSTPEPIKVTKVKKKKSTKPKQASSLAS